MPALFETTVRSLTSGRSRTALIKELGTPEKPKPPTRMVDEPVMSLTASLAEGDSLSMARLVVDTEKFRRHRGRKSAGTAGNGLDMVPDAIQGGGYGRESNGFRKKGSQK